jgi:hypothetical protein
MLRPIREQSGTSRTNPSEPEAKPLSSQPPPKIPEPPQATTTALATNYTISDDRSNSSQHDHNLLLALQDQSRGTLFASFEPQTVTSAGLSSGKYTSDRGPSVNQLSEEGVRSYPDVVANDPPSPSQTSAFVEELFDGPSRIRDPGVSIPKVRSVCNVTNINLANRIAPGNRPEFCASRLPNANDAPRTTK